MVASGGLWVWGCAGVEEGVDLASSAALSCATCLLRAANSSWWDLESSDVLLDPLIVSTRSGTGGLGVSWCCCVSIAARTALFASAWANWSFWVAMVDSRSDTAELAMPAS